MAKAAKVEVSPQDFAASLTQEIARENEDVLVTLLEDGSPSDVSIFIPTGSQLLDYIMANRRNGGIPVGKITEISGLEGSGKTLLGMTIAGNAQRMGGLVIYFDSENALNTDFAERVGLDVKKNFIYIQPDSVESVFSSIFTLCHKIDDMEKTAKTKPYKFVLVIWDSIAGTSTRKTVTEEDPDPNADMMIKPRILSKNMNELVRRGAKREIAFVCLNQLRMVPNVKPFMDPYVVPGGKATAFAYSLRLRMISKGTIKSKNDDVVGVTTMVKTVKCRFGPPHRTVEFPIHFTNGIDDVGSIFVALGETGAMINLNGYEVRGTLHFRGDTDKKWTKAEFREEWAKNPAFKERCLAELDKKMIRDLHAEGVTEEPNLPESEG